MDPKLISWEEAKAFKEALKKLGNIDLVPVKDNLVDAVWLDKPKRSLQPIKELPVEFTGRTHLDKLEWLRRQILAKQCGAILLTALDEIACTCELSNNIIATRVV